MKFKYSFLIKKYGVKKWDHYQKHLCCSNKIYFGRPLELIRVKINLNNKKNNPATKSVNKYKQ